LTITDFAKSFPGIWAAAAMCWAVYALEWLIIMYFTW